MSEQYGGTSTSPADIERVKRENAAKHEKALNERPESTPSLKESSRKLFELAKSVFDRARALRESEKSDGFKLSDGEGNTIFSFTEKIAAATTLNGRIKYSSEDNKGTVTIWEGLPAGFNHNVVEINFWTDEEGSAKGSKQATNAQGPREKDIMTAEELSQEASDVATTFEEVLNRLEEAK